MPSNYWMINRIGLLFLIPFIGILYSCSRSTDPCLLPKDALIKARFVKLASGSDSAFVDTSFQRLRFNPINSTLPYDTTGNITGSSYLIALNSNANSASYELIPDVNDSSAQPDTITIQYDRYLKFLSNACGYTNFYNIKSIKGNFRNLSHLQQSVDSVVLVDPNVSTNGSVVNLRIYFHR